MTAKTHLNLGQTVHTDALHALNILAESHHHVARVTPPEVAFEWLPWVHVVISNFKTFVLGIYHGISGKYLQDYLNEYSYRLNRRFWEPYIPNRLLRLAINHQPVVFSTCILFIAIFFITYVIWEQKIYHRLISHFIIVHKTYFETVFFI